VRATARFSCPLLTSSPSRYVINIRQYAKFVVALHDDVASTDVEEGMRVGVDRQTYKIMLPLPAKIDPTVTMMQARQCPPLEMQCT
jgi:26S proteasome regulatory subunit T1